MNRGFNLFRSRNVNFIHRANHGEPGTPRGLGICQGLRLNALGRVHEEHRALDCSKRAGNLVAKIRMPRRINEVEYVLNLRGFTRIKTRIFADRKASCIVHNSFNLQFLTSEIDKKC